MAFPPFLGQLIWKIHGGNWGKWVNEATGTWSSCHSAFSFSIRFSHFGLQFSAFGFRPKGKRQVESRWKCQWEPLPCCSCCHCVGSLGSAFVGMHGGGTPTNVSYLGFRPRWVCAALVHGEFTAHHLRERRKRAATSGKVVKTAVLSSKNGNHWASRV